MTEQQKRILKQVGFPAYWGYKKTRKIWKKVLNKIQKTRKKLHDNKKTIQAKRKEKNKYSYALKHPLETAENTYYKRLGRRINWDNPQDLNEKINWLKFHADPHEWARLADKYQVREYVKSRGLGDTLVPLYGKWNTVQGVLNAWDSLPDEFILKSNNGCGNKLIVCKETGGKAAVNMDALKVMLKSWLNQKAYGLLQGELHYQLIKENWILAEQLLKAENLLDEELIVHPLCPLVNYNIWCMNGKPYGCMSIYDRHVPGKGFVDWYDLKWEQHTEALANQTPRCRLPKPENWDQMLETAAVLSQGHPLVRIDLYSIRGKIYFGEMTFTSAAGYNKHYTPEQLLNMGKAVTLDLNMPGNMFLPKKNRAHILQLDHYARHVPQFAKAGIAEKLSA